MGRPPLVLFLRTVVYSVVLFGFSLLLGWVELVIVVSEAGGGSVDGL
jgi:hypothetical protein